MFRLDSTPPPLGAHLTTGGCVFAVAASAVTTTAEVCVISDDGVETATTLSHRLGNTWWAHIEGVKAGDRYGFRMTGPGQLRSKFLVDPYARAIEGDIDWKGAAGALKPSDPRNSEPYVPKSIVVDTRFDWGSDALPNVPWSETIIYEAHVKGSTKLLDAVPESIQIDQVHSYLAGLPGVSEVHDLHIWGMSTTENALTVHLVMPGGHPGDAFVSGACQHVHDTFRIVHTTIQVETDPTHPCKLAPDHVV